jgi:diaminopimelate decarboxylase
MDQVPATPALPRSLHRDSHGVLRLAGLDLAALGADPKVGTPAYVYDLGGIEAEAKELALGYDGAPHLICYAIKANSAGAILRTLVQAGCGADIVSGAELRLALAAGFVADTIVFSGVAKTDDELDAAITAGAEGILAIQVESLEEVSRIAARARALGRSARVSLRVNPEVEIESMGTHVHIATGHDEAKFGVPLHQVASAVQAVLAEPSLRLVGLTSHTGSQFTQTAPYLTAARTLLGLARDFSSKVSWSFLDTGGGFGIDYGQGCPVRPQEFVRAVRGIAAELGLGGIRLLCEPGRSLVAAHGVLLARVLQTKITQTRRFVMVDAGMNDLMRPALYQARHRIVPCLHQGGSVEPFRVVGPVCESTCDFGPYTLPSAPSGLLAFLDAGAYGYTMASRYNGRALPSEVFLRDGAVVNIVSRAPVSAWVEDRLRSM